MNINIKSTNISNSKIIGHASPYLKNNTSPTKLLNYRILDRIDITALGSSMVVGAATASVEPVDWRVDRTPRGPCHIYKTTSICDAGVEHGGQVGAT